jgi:geranylgeranyl reductase family protein
MHTPDVIIVGAGPAGSATAYFLARAGVHVLLLDKASFPRDKTCGDGLSPRAQHMLAAMGLLDTVAQQAHSAEALHLYAPNAQRAVAAVHSEFDLPNRTLILPRQTFDHLLQQHAIAAGAHFRVARVRGLLREGGQVAGVKLAHETLRAPLVVLATGATTGLPSEAGLLPRRPRLSVAARRYFQGVSEVGQHLDFYFDNVPLPGYGWLFPTGPDSANVGIWYGGRWPLSSRAAFVPFVQQHPRLRRLLAGAQAKQPLKSYPLRTDFLQSRRLQPGVLGVGEAVGLVNPFTGEGIDYALESGQMAAGVIAEALAQGPPTYERLLPYVRQLDAHFRRLFVVMSVAHTFYFNAPTFNRIFGRGERSQQLVDGLIRICFGGGDPLHTLRPRFVLDLFRP